MLSRDNSQPLYITVGGQGGPGGQGHPHGTGGPGGAGLGPTVHITAHNLHATFTSEETSQLSTIRASQIANHCPPPSRIFQGRRNILDKMHNFFTSDVGIQHIYVLHGLGGAGKTQIALKFIKESSSHFSDMFFIDASTTATIDTGLKNIAVAKNAGDSPQDGLLWLASRAEEYTAGKAHRRGFIALLVFDNTDDPSINLNDFIPQCNHGNIIITSRNPGLCVYGSHSHVLDMEEKDAVALLFKSAAQEATIHTEQIAMEIVKALYCLPLAIVQADLGSYLAFYTKSQAQLLSEKPAQSHDRYAWTVYTTWQMSFDRLTPLAATFLQLCSFLHHSGISEEIFSYASKYRFSSDGLSEGFYGPSQEEQQAPLEFLSEFLRPTGEWDSLKFLRVTNEVQAYSLINFDSEKKLFSIHPLVHAWCQTASTIGSILGMAISKHSRENIQLAIIIQMDAKVALGFMHQYTFILRRAGKYKQTGKLLEGVLEKQKQGLGVNHPDTLNNMGNLASTYLYLGKHQKAEELMVLVLEKQKQVLGDNHPHTLLTISNLAETYSGLGEHRKGEELVVSVLEKRKQVLGDNHPDTLLTMSNLASTYLYLGENQKAKELMVSVLEKQKQVLGDNHPETLRTMGNLAETYSQLGEHQKAEELMVSVLEEKKKVLGDNHPHTLLTMSNLANPYLHLGENQKAEELMVSVLEKQKQVLGDNHPQTLRTMGNLAETYSRLGEHRKGEELVVSVLEKRKQVLGDNHPDTLLTMSNLANTYLHLGEHQKAKELMVSVLEKQKQVLGVHHPDTLHTMGNLAETYSRLGEHQNGEELVVSVLEKWKQVLGDNHPDTLLTMSNLASTYLHLGENQKAEKLMVSVLEKQKQVLGDNHPHILHPLGNLFNTYSAQILSEAILVPDQPFILTLIARMQDQIVDKTESEVD
ncbi:hypothetical protein K438DRAFT_1849200 [Mycena galopus ATCC 62051]|nr:hypothetical protein K438DRAFT_1849200 [Mycena galopus ATCC 62051]